MSSKCNSGFFSMPMILVLVLVYFFRMELYMAGVRAVTLISPNPTLDKKLGDYYKELSEKSTALSQKFYDSATTAVKQPAPTVVTEPNQKPN